MAEFLGMEAFEDDATLSDFVSDDQTDDDDTNQNNNDDQSDDGQDDKNNAAADDTTDDDGDDLGDKDDTKDKDTASQNTSNSQYSAFTTAFREAVPFLDGDDEVKVSNAEEFDEYVSTKIDEEVQAREFADLNEDQKKYLETLRAGVPEEEIKQNLTMEQQINSITDESIETDDKLRSTIIYQAFRQEGLSEARAQKLTKMSIESGDDIEDAKESLATLKSGVQKQIEAKKQAGLDAQKQAKKDYDEQMKSLKDTINDPEKTLGTKKLATKYREDLYELITKPVKHGDKEVNFLNKYLLDNPVEANVVLAHLYKITDGFDPKKIGGLNGKAIKSKAAKEMSKLIQQGNWNQGSDSDSMDLSHLDDKNFDHLGADGSLF